MMCSRQEFDLWVDVCSECASKNISTKRRNWYYSFLKTIDASLLEKAFSLFSAKAVFPSVNDILMECGFQPDRSREQQEAFAVQHKSQKMPQDEDQSLHGLFGSYAFCYDKITDSRQTAEKYFDEIQREKLEPAGWKVRERTIHEFSKEVTEGCRTFKASGFRCFFDSQKLEG